MGGPPPCSSEPILFNYQLIPPPRPPLACERISNCCLKFNRLSVGKLFVALPFWGNRHQNGRVICFLIISKSCSVILYFLLTPCCFSLMHFCSNILYLSFVPTVEALFFFPFFSFSQGPQPFDVFITNTTIIPPYSNPHYPQFISLLHKTRKGSKQRTAEVGRWFLRINRDGGRFLFPMSVVGYLICSEVMVIWEVVSPDMFPFVTIEVRKGTEVENLYVAIYRGIDISLYCIYASAPRRHPSTQWADRSL